MKTIRKKEGKNLAKEKLIETTNPVTNNNEDNDQVRTKKWGSIDDRIRTNVQYYDGPGGLPPRERDY